MTPVQTPADLRPITALRFGAAMWVAVYSFWENLAGAGQSGLVAKGYLGVELFFVLSGYLITSQLWSRWPLRGIDLKAFWAARVRRLAPAALLLLAVTTLVVDRLQTELDDRGRRANIAKSRNESRERYRDAQLGRCPVRPMARDGATELR